MGKRVECPYLTPGGRGRGRSDVRSAETLPVVDGGRQGAYGDVDQLAEPERGVLDEAALAPQEEVLRHLAVIEVGAVDDGEGDAVRQVLADSDPQVQPAVVATAQLDKAVQIA